MTYQISVCICIEGPYLGAQKMGTVARCERCGFITVEQLKAIVETYRDTF